MIQEILNEKKIIPGEEKSLENDKFEKNMNELLVEV